MILNSQELYLALIGHQIPLSWVLRSHGTLAFRLDQIRSEWIRFVKIGSDLFQLDQIRSNYIKLHQITSNQVKLDPNNPYFAVPWHFQYYVLTKMFLIFSRSWYFSPQQCQLFTKQQFRFRWCRRRKSGKQFWWWWSDQVFQKQPA